MVCMSFSVVCTMRLLQLTTPLLVPPVSAHMCSALLLRPHTAMQRWTDQPPPEVDRHMQRGRTAGDSDVHVLSEYSI